jgi:hypothetical protein
MVRSKKAEKKSRGCLSCVALPDVSTFSIAARVKPSYPEGNFGAEVEAAEKERENKEWK